MRANVCVRLRTREYDEVLRTNNRGLVGPEVTATKQPAEFRIVVLGDSYTVGGQVPYEQTFPAVLERALHNRGYAGVRVVNAGVGGYTTLNEAGLLREDIGWLQPDLVVVAAFVGNDVAENVLATAAGYVVDPGHAKGLTFGPTASDLIQKSIDWFPRNRVSRSSTRDASTRDALNGFKTVARQSWNAARGNSLVPGALFGTQHDPSVGSAPGSRPLSTDQRQLNLSSFEWTVLRDIPPVYWLDRAWHLLGQYLSDIRATAASANAPVLVLIIPQIGQVVPAERARTMDDYRFAEDEVDWDRPQRELRAQADGAGDVALDVLPAFRDAPQRDALYLPIDQHFTAEGHRLTAELLAQEIMSRRWIP
jgi:GDSL-like Lipase/Acylhydrolase family/SGNH hydrolase-like domain, acetyltransferase AlgX